MLHLYSLNPSQTKWQRVVQFVFIDKEVPTPSDVVRRMVYFSVADFYGGELGLHTQDIPFRLTDMRWDDAGNRTMEDVRIGYLSRDQLLRVLQFIQQEDTGALSVYGRVVDVDSPDSRGHRA